MNLLDGGQRKRVARIYDEACAAMEAENWREAVYKLDQVRDITPEFPGAAWRQQEAHQWHKTNTQYEVGRKHMDAERWSEALQVFRQVQTQAPNYKDTSVLMSMCERAMLGRTASVGRIIDAAKHGESKLALLALAASLVIGFAILWLTFAPTDTQPTVALTEPTATGTPIEQARPTTTVVVILVTATSAPTAVNSLSTPTAVPGITQAPAASPSSTPSASTPTVRGPTTRPTLSRTPTPRATATRTATPRGSTTPSIPIGNTPTASTPVATSNATAVGPVTPTPTVAVLINTETPASPRIATATLLATPTARLVIVEANEYRFNPPNVTFTAGERIRLTLTNKGKLEHDWVMVDQSGKILAKVTAAVGFNGVIEFVAPTPSSYNIVCDIGDHTQQGMTGKATVQ